MKPAYKDNIAVYHSIKSPELKKHILDQFRTGEVRLLLATEAVGMGCDINDIARVVQRPVSHTMDKHLVQFIQAEGCRRRGLNEIFGNSHHNYPSCCDNCHPEPQGVVETVWTDAEANDGMAAKATRTPCCTAEHRAIAKKAIEDWRQTVLELEYLPESSYYTLEAVMGMNYVNKLADKCLQVVAAALSKISSVGTLEVNDAFRI
ncbi:hypothetical protein EDD21DRAFT_419037 [Dissophora ornata]|nr:hypothetical protein EDD21DRAFT_419037 [Dissophora ornata]